MTLDRIDYKDIEKERRQQQFESVHRFGFIMQC